MKTFLLTGSAVVCFGLGLLIPGCRRAGETQQRYDLPKSLTLPAKGWVQYLSPSALIDSLDRGMDAPLFFLKDYPSFKEEYFVPLPGMRVILASEIFNVMGTLSQMKPVILTCTYGDDSKRVADMLSVRGFNSYCLDGGTYRMRNEMTSGRLKPLPMPGDAIPK